MIRPRRSLLAVLTLIALLVPLGAGGAYAAKKYTITSLGQIKPSVVKKLKGQQGPIGPAGAVGPAGPTGAKGAAGDTGPSGTSFATYVFKDASVAIGVVGDDAAAGTVVATVNGLTGTNLMTATLDVKASRLGAGSTRATCRASDGTGFDEHDFVAVLPSAGTAQSTMSFTLRVTGPSVTLRCSHGTGDVVEVDTFKATLIKVDNASSTAL